MDTPSAASPDDGWWRTFFESPDCLRLAFFPSERTTAEQVAALHHLMSRWAVGRVLDLCCGAGRHLVPLRRLGHPLVGLDVSQFMLDRAQTDAERAGVRAPLVRGQGQALPFADGAFDAILCLFNSFGYLPDDENGAFIHEAARCLRRGGRFLLDTRNRAYQLSNLPISEIVPLDGGGAVWLECSHDVAHDRLVSVFRSPGSGEVLYRASIRCYSLAELREMLARAGLEVQSVSGGYDWRPFNGRSREILVLARRGEGS